MDFARNLLLKYGWKEGKGLGKKESGIAKAIKPKLKFNTDGLGFDHSEQFTHNWWEQAYNSAASNIDVSTTHDGNLTFKTLNNDSTTLTTKKTFISASEKETFEYGTFKKVGVLEDKVFTETIPRSKDETEKNDLPIYKQLTDEELYLACGGRTAHKAARHGHKMNGKLLRLNEQDQLYSINNAKVNSSTPQLNKEDETDMNIKKHSKKTKLKNDKLVETSEYENCVKKKKRKHISEKYVIDDVQEFSKKNKTHKSFKNEYEEKCDKSDKTKRAKRKKKEKSV